jgi:hypothetical protein
MKKVSLKELWIRDRTAEEFDDYFHVKESRGM